MARSWLPCTGSDTPPQETKAGKYGMLGLCGQCSRWVAIMKLRQTLTYHAPERPKREAKPR
jgi:hypothetical protein